MSTDFEEQLRRALRPVDPDAGFEQRVMVRIEREPAPVRSRQLRWLPAVIAASTVLVAVIGTQQWQARREEQGLEARRQLLEALRVTGEKLDLAYQAVNRESQPTTTGGSGA